MKRYKASLVKKVTALVTKLKKLGYTWKNISSNVRMKYPQYTGNAEALAQFYSTKIRKNEEVDTAEQTQTKITKKYIPPPKKTISELLVEHIQQMVERKANIEVLRMMQKIKATVDEEIKILNNKIKECGDGETT